ncbi:MAG: hypothetical protein HY362_02170 [Candidatus Aenigmarchaeota archaeon]|nr:hypothetical protein [Candidatus Aenigmarchaeota archaeon]
MDIPEDYLKLEKKYKGLPEWKWLSTNFRVKLENGGLVEQVRHSVSEKLDNVSHSLIEPIIGPGESYCCWFERKMITDTDRDELFNIYRQLQALIWRSNKISITESEKDFAEWLIRVEKEWEGLRPALEKFCMKLEEGWLKYKKPIESTSYHG